MTLSHRSFLISDHAFRSSYRLIWIGGISRTRMWLVCPHHGRFGALLQSCATRLNTRCWCLGDESGLSTPAASLLSIVSTPPLFVSTGRSAWPGVSVPHWRIANQILTGKLWCPFGLISPEICAPIVDPLLTWLWTCMPADFISSFATPRWCFCFWYFPPSGS